MVHIDKQGTKLLEKRQLTWRRRSILPTRCFIRRAGLEAARQSVTSPTISDLSRRSVDRHTVSVHV